MIEIIFLVIFLFSLIGMGIILIRKIPILAELSVAEIKKEGVLEKLKKRIKNNGAIKSFSGRLLLQKILSKVRILNLKAESKTAGWLMKLRQKTVEKKNKFSEDYWKKLRKRK